MDLNDSKHFADKVKAELKKWGFGFDYEKAKGVNITYAPSLEELRLMEILRTQYNLDVQTDTYAFACFITALTDIEGFDSMPWEERASELEKYYGVKVSDRTLRNWCSKLIKKNAIAKVSGSTFWKTVFVDGEKVRSKVKQEDVANYYNRRREILREEIGKKVLAGMDAKAAYKAAWESVYPLLWAEFKCCYYCCKSFLLAAFSDEALTYEIIELTREISAERQQKFPNRFS